MAETRDRPAMSAKITPQRTKASSWRLPRWSRGSGRCCKAAKTVTVVAGAGGGSDITSPRQRILCHPYLLKNQDLFYEKTLEQPGVVRADYSHLGPESVAKPATNGPGSARGRCGDATHRIGKRE